MVATRVAEPVDRFVPQVSPSVPLRRDVHRIKSADDPDVNASGLNGLTVGGTDALETGKFTVSAAQPIHYTVREVPGLLNPANEVRLASGCIKIGL